MMTYSEFKEQLKNQVQEQFEKRTVILDEVVKRNDTKLACITFKEKDGVTPRIYLDGLYQSFLIGNNDELDEIADMVTNLLKNNDMIKENILTSVPESWEEAESKIHLAFVKKEWNQKWLENLLYMEYLDFAVVFEVHTQFGSEENAKIMITNDIIDKWNVSLDEVWEAAKKNLFQENFMIVSLEKFLGMEVMGKLPVMFVMTSDDRLGGSAALYRKDLLKEFADEKETDLYIIPSSMDELLLVEKTEDVSVDELRAMVKIVNSDPQSIKPEECLSDEIYLYERESNKLLIV